MAIKEIANGILDLVGLKLTERQALVQSPRYRDQVQEYMDAIGVRIERPNPHIPLLQLDQFDRDVSASEHAHRRRLGNDRRIPNNKDSLM